MSATASILPGFADPVGQAQQAFRAVLDAMARPGTIRRLAIPEAKPDLWTPAMASLGLTLFDQDTPVWLDSQSKTAEALAYLRFHCGCPIVTDPGKAGFVVLADAAAAPPLHTFSIGDPLYPERSATVVVQIRSLSDGPALTLGGPGIRGRAQVNLAGLPDEFAAQWAGNHALYPSGVDVIFASGNSVVALPRTVAIREA